VRFIPYKNSCDTESRKKIQTAIKLNYLNPNPGGPTMKVQRKKLFHSAEKISICTALRVTSIHLLFEM
jgi:hypothetical protein